MKLIIAGGRDLPVYNTFVEALLEQLDIDQWNIREVVHGGCPTGVDQSVELWCQGRHADSSIPESRVFPADWEAHGRAAGPIRNRQMAEYADALLLVWDGQSRGSASMKREMQKLGKPIYEVILRKEGM